VLGAAKKFLDRSDEAADIETLISDVETGKVVVVGKLLEQLGPGKVGKARVSFSMYLR
jgi:hypothetical protein